MQLVQLTETLAATTVQTIPVLALALLIEYRILVRQDVRRRNSRREYREQALRRLRDIGKELKSIGLPEDWPDEADRNRNRERVGLLVEEFERLTEDPRWKPLKLRHIWRIFGILSYGLVAVLNGTSMIICVRVLIGDEPATLDTVIVVISYVASTTLLVLTPFVTTYFSWLSSMRARAESKRIIRSHVRGR